MTYSHSSLIVLLLCYLQCAWSQTSVITYKRFLKNEQFTISLTLSLQNYFFCYLLLSGWRRLDYNYNNCRCLSTENGKLPSQLFHLLLVMSCFFCMQPVSSLCVHMCWMNEWLHALCGGWPGYENQCISSIVIIFIISVTMTLRLNVEYLTLHCRCATSLACWSKWDSASARPAIWCNC
jgi:hypothetical protein